MHHDPLGSAIQALDDTGTQAMRLGYSPFGQVYRKHNNKTQWKINTGVNANKQLGQLMPYQFTGAYTDGNTGLVHLDARWYNPHTSRFVQPDYWNFKNTYLPAEIQHELMQFTGLNANQLLRDPNQQLAFGYVSGNPLVYVDPFGLAEACGALSINGNEGSILSLSEQRKQELESLYKDGQLGSIDYEVAMTATEYVDFDNTVVIQKSIGAAMGIGVQYTDTIAMDAYGISQLNTIDVHAGASVALAVGYYAGVKSEIMFSDGETIPMVGIGSGMYVEMGVDVGYTWQR